MKRMRTICGRVFLSISKRGYPLSLTVLLLVLSHARRDSCSKSRQAEPETGAGVPLSDAQPQIQHPHILPNGIDRNVRQQETFCQGSLIASQQPRGEPGGLEQHSMSRGDYAALALRLHGGRSQNLPSD